jgi:hypothetical protein
MADVAPPQQGNVPSTPRPGAPAKMPQALVVATTAVLSCLATLAVTFVVAVAVSSRPPPTPSLPTPKSLTVTIYPAPRIHPGEPPTEIPADKLDYALRLLTPDKYYGSNVNDRITPLIAEVTLDHGGPVYTTILVRDSGKNPALVSIDGENYFYAPVYEDTQAGAVQLIRLVRQVRERAKAGRREGLD